MHRGNLQIFKSYSEADRLALVELLGFLLSRTWKFQYFRLQKFPSMHYFCSILLSIGSKDVGTRLTCNGGVDLTLKKLREARGTARAQ